MTPKTLSVYVGETKKVVAKVSPDNADDKTVTWDSGKSNLVNVVDGSVTGVKAGKVSISAEADGKSDVCEVTILEPIVHPKSVTITPTSVVVDVGKTQALTATVLPVNTTDKKVNWKSENIAIATVSPTGVVTGVKAGKVRISAEAGGKSDVRGVTVLGPPKSITGAPTSVTVDVGKTHALTATVLPVDTTDQKVNWKSENIAIATVSPAGVVTGEAVPKEEGQAKTFVVGTTQASPSVTVRVPVTVTKVPEVPEVKKEE